MKGDVIFICLIFLFGFNVPFVLGLWSIGSVDDYFHCSDSDGYDTPYKYLGKESSEAITYTISGDRIGLENIYEEGETYGKLKIYDNDFVTRKDSCVTTELNEISSGDVDTINADENGGRVTRDEDNPKMYFFGLESSSGQVLTCRDGNCFSAAVKECVGKNCGLIEYGCSSDLDIYDYFRLLFKHPSFLFGSEQLYTFGSTINICENGCTQGACVKLRIGEKCGSDFGPACESNLCVSGYCVEKQD